MTRSEDSAERETGTGGEEGFIGSSVSNERTSAPIPVGAAMMATLVGESFEITPGGAWVTVPLYTLLHAGGGWEHGSAMEDGIPIPTPEAGVFQASARIRTEYTNPDEVDSYVSLVFHSDEAGDTDVSTVNVPAAPNGNIQVVLSTLVFTSPADETIQLKVACGNPGFTVEWLRFRLVKVSSFEFEWGD